MPNDYVYLDVPANNGAGAALAFTNRSTRTVIVAGTWAGLVVIEGSFDGTDWVPFPDAALHSAGFITIEQPVPQMRVRRRGIGPFETPGTPIVSVGSSAVIVGTDQLAAPVALNGGGVASTLGGYIIESITVAGAYPNTGMLVNVDISMDNVCWTPIGPAFGQGTTRLAKAICARFARQRITGRTTLAATPVVSISGQVPDTNLCFEDLPLPALNGAGTSVDTSGCGAAKTIICGAPGAILPGLVAIEGSNDNGTTWTRLTAFNTGGLRQINALCMLMRTNVSGLTAAVAGLCVGVGAIEAPCETPTEGASTDIATIDPAAFVDDITLATPAGAAEGDLLIAAVAVTYAPSLLTSPVAPGAIAVIIPADTDGITGWTTVLADSPGGTNDMTDQGAGNEEDRFAVFRHVVTAAEAAVPVNHVFSFTLGGGPVSAVGVIKAFASAIPTFAPSVHDAAAAVNIAVNAGNPMNVVAPSMTPTETFETLVCFFVARNGISPAPGGSTFSTPGGMADLSTPINLQTDATSDPLGMAVFIETVSGGLPTGTKTSVVTQDNVPSNPFQGMGYSILITGCTAPPGVPFTPTPA